jgi:ferritin heavy chain
MWSERCACAVNEQINHELNASYQYHNLFTYFNNDSVGFQNIAKYFNKASIEERDHAHTFMEYQNKRGGRVELKEIPQPTIDLYSCANNTDMLEAFREAYKLEEFIYSKLLELHKIGSEENDPQFTDFIEGEFLEEQIQAMYELKVYIAQLERIGNDGHGLWQFNQEFDQEK